MTRILHTLRLTALCLTAALLSSVSVYADDTVSETFIFNTSTGLQAMGFDVSSLDQSPNLDLEENQAYSIGGSVSFSNNNNGTPTRIFKDSNGALTLRIYNGAQLTFSVPEGCFIERINFTRSGSNFNLSPISGDYYWNTSKQVSSITFTADGSTYLQQVEVLYTRPSSSEASVAAPTVSPAACTFTQRPFQVSLSCATEGASIYYTTDGSTPAAKNGTLYTPSSPIMLTNTTTVKAIAVLNDVASNVAVATYTYEPVAENHPALFQVVTNVSEITADHTYLIGSANKDGRLNHKEFADHTYLIGSANKGYVLGYQKARNRQAVAATITDAQLSVEKLASDTTDTSNPYPLTFIPDGTGKFLIKDMVSGKYLACGTGQKNQLISTKQGYAASVTIDAKNDATLILSNTTNKGYCYMAFNSFDELFNCYTQNPSEDPVQIYKQLTGRFTITEASYATYYTDKAFIMPDGVKGGIVTERPQNGGLVLTYYYTPGSLVPPLTPIVLKGNAGNYIFPLTSTTEEAPAGNLLRGTLSDGNTASNDDASGTTYYQLSMEEEGVGFYYGADNGAAFDIGANKAYLVLTTEQQQSMKQTGLIFTDIEEDVPAAIAPIRHAAHSAAHSLYDLGGRQVQPKHGTLPQGIYIMNGQKVLVR